MNSEFKDNNIKELLNSSSRDLSPEIAEKLHAARTLALQHQRTRTVPLLGWIYAHVGFPGYINLFRPMNTVIASFILAACLVTGYTVVEQHLNEYEITDIDLAILTDEMPLHVYVD